MLNNKYLLTKVVAARANQLEKGSKPLVETKYRKPTMIALEEVKAGKVFLKEKKEPLKSEDVFHGEEKSVKMEESVKPEDFPNEVEESVKPEDLLNENEKPGELENLLNENEKPKSSLNEDIN